MIKLIHFLSDKFNRIFGIGIYNEIKIEVKSKLIPTEIHIEVDSSYHTDMEKLNNNMNMCIEKEDYESAIVIRDIINNHKNNKSA